MMLVRIQPSPHKLIWAYRLAGFKALALQARDRVFESHYAYKKFGEVAQRNFNLNLTRPW